MKKRLGAIVFAVAAGAAAAGMFAGESNSAGRYPHFCGLAWCPLALTEAGPSPSTFKMLAGQYVRFVVADSATHTVVFANGHCSLTVTPGKWRGHQCKDPFTRYVGSYAYTVDGKFRGKVVTKALRRSVTLNARTHTVRRGTRLTLHGHLAWQHEGGLLHPTPFPIAILARHNNTQRFEPIARITGGIHGPPAGDRYGWTLTVHPRVTTTYMAKARGQLPGGQIWTNARSRPFTVRVGRSGPNAQRTIGLILTGPGNPIAPEVERGGRAAAAALGDRLAVTVTEDATSTIDSLIAKHAAAIVDDNEQDDPAVSRALARARHAGIPTLSFEDRYPGTVWVSQSSPVEYAHALSDALASQMKSRGQFIIVPCRPAASFIGTLLRAAKTYIRHRYPHMHRVGVVYGGTGNGPAGTLVLRPLLRKHPQLRGLIFLCPSESYEGPPQLVHAHEVGKVFSAGNGGDCPPLYIKLANSVRAGAAEMVCAGNPTHLGYLTVWAAHYLATGQSLTPRAYDVGGPVGTVHYYAHDQELRLGRPLTITKHNLAKYGVSR